MAGTIKSMAKGKTGGKGGGPKGAGGRGNTRTISKLGPSPKLGR